MRVRSASVWWVVAGLVVAGCLAAAGVIWAARGLSASAQVLSAGESAPLSAPGGPLTTLVDGRLSSYGVTADVESVGFAHRAGSGADAVTAGPGTELAVVHVAVTVHPDEDLSRSFSLPQAVHLSVDSARGSTALDPGVTDGGHSDQYVAVSVTKGAPAVLRLSVNGLVPQSLDLRTGHRIGSQPAALYRDGTAPLVTSRSTESRPFSVASSDGGTATGTIGLRQATLSYWAPASTATAPDPSYAYLSLYFQPSDLALSTQPGAALDVPPLPGAAVDLQLPDGRLIPTAHEQPSTTPDLLSGAYYALVPANLTGARVIVAPGTSARVGVPLGDYYDDRPITLGFQSSFSSDIRFEPAWQPPARPQAPPGTPAVAPRPSGIGLGWWLLGGAVALGIAAGAAIALRRRPLIPAQPVRWPPSAASLRSSRLMTEAFGRRRGLAAGPHASRAAPAMVVRVLGPLEVEGLRRPLRRGAVGRALVALAVIPERPLRTDELAVAIADNLDRDPDPDMVEEVEPVLRRSLPSGILTSEAGGKRIALDHRSVVVDWNVLAAVAAGPKDHPGWLQGAGAALELVRGEPLADCSWVGIESARRVMKSTIETLARTVGRERLQAGDAPGAEDAIRRGLAAYPASVGLWQDRLDAAAAGSGYGLNRAWRDARHALGPDAAVLAGHYRELLHTIDQAAIEA